jgi:very-short-patch-repair endonuclease
MPGSAPNPLPAPLAARPFSTAEARSRGVTGSRLRAQDLSRPFFGVRSTAAPSTTLDLARAYAEWMRPDQFFSHLTAAALWDLPLPSRLDATVLHVTTPGRQRSARGMGVIGHRTQRASTIRTVGGLRVADPARTWLDVVPLLTLDEAIILGDAVVSVRRDGGALATIEQLGSLVDRARGVRGLRTARAALIHVRAGSASPAETLLRLAIVRRGLPEPTLNEKVFRQDGRYLGRADFVYWDQRIAIEYESDRHRVDAEQWRRDLRRRERFEDAGWRVIRANGDDLHRTSDSFHGRLRRLLVERAPR